MYISVSLRWGCRKMSWVLPCSIDLAQQHIDALLAGPRGLAHVVGHDDDRIFFPQVVDQRLDGLRSLGVQGRAGLVHQDHPRLERQQRAMHSFCCCSSVSSVALACSLSLTSFHRKTSSSADCDQLVAAGAVERVALGVHVQAEQHVFVDRDRQRIGPLKHHAHGFAQFGQRNVGVVDVLAQDRDFAGRLDVAVPLVDAVEAAQQAGLAAARGTDQRRHARVANVDFDVLEGLEISVPEIQAARLDAVLRRVERGHQPMFPVT